MKIPTKTITVYTFDAKKIEDYRILFKHKYTKDMLTLMINYLENDEEWNKVLKVLR